ncbi:MAG: hypothetical protein JWO84_731, partial [Parcubacteria group bacterium]|nr:hypothetical protein [Parcubacteria group bacterium]
HTFDEFELCARIEQMIRKQPDGEAGDLLNKAHMDMNQFYTSSCMVRLCWRAYIYNEWQLSVWKLGDHAYQGCRVFSRN